jgi:hypothetical protein
MGSTGSRKDPHLACDVATQSDLLGAKLEDDGSEGEFAVATDFAAAGNAKTQ